VRDRTAPGSGSSNKRAASSEPARGQMPEPVTFAAYMKRALYGDHDGFYVSRARPSPQTDFVTAPLVSPLFGVCVAKFVLDCLDRQSPRKAGRALPSSAGKQVKAPSASPTSARTEPGRPPSTRDTFYILELGGRDPHLAASVLASLVPDLQMLDARLQSVCRSKGIDTPVFEEISRMFGVPRAPMRPIQTALAYIAVDPGIASEWSGDQSIADRPTGDTQRGGHPFGAPQQQGALAAATPVLRLQNGADTPAVSGVSYLRFSALQEARRFVESLADPRGIVIANEVLDNQPAHLLAKVGGGNLLELYVSTREDGKLELRTCPLSEGARRAVRSGAVGRFRPLAALPRELAGRIEVAIDELKGRTATGDERSPRYGAEGRTGAQIEVAIASPAQTDLLEDIIGFPGCEAFLFFDMSPDAFSTAPIKTYRRHAQGYDPLAAPGDSDICVEVLWEKLRDRACRAGFVTKLLGQSEWLAARGLSDAVRALESALHEPHDTTVRFPDKWLVFRSLLVGAKALLDPAAFGSFWVLEGSRAEDQDDC
jgi:SAM-dependent MidA family methyltransferase